MEASLIVSLVGLIVSSFVAYLIAKNYGDMAAAKATIDFEKERAARARVAAFQSLINEVARIRKLTEYYEALGPSGVPKMPMTAFETAFVSGSSSLIASSGLLEAVNEYLVRADIVNSVIDIYLILEHRGEFADIKRACGPLAEILDRLDECLKRELEA